VRAVKEEREERYCTQALYQSATVQLDDLRFRYMRGRLLQAHKGRRTLCAACEQSNQPQICAGALAHARANGGNLPAIGVILSRAALQGALAIEGSRCGGESWEQCEVPIVA